MQRAPNRRSNHPDDLAQAVMKAADASTPKRDGSQAETLAVGSPERRRRTGLNAGGGS